RILLPLRDRARGIVDVSERDRLGGTDLLTRRADFAVADLPAVLRVVDARFLDALHAVGALLHDAARADGDVGIALELRDLGLEVLVEVEVEAPDLVRVVVEAIARSDAAVVGHLVQTFVAVRRRADRAD